MAIASPLRADGSFMLLVMLMATDWGSGFAFNPGPVA